MARPKKKNEINIQSFSTRLPEKLIIKLKHYAIDIKKPISEIVAQALTEYLERNKNEPQ